MVIHERIFTITNKKGVMRKRDDELNVGLEFKPWAKIGKAAFGLLLIGFAIYYIAMFDLIDRFWVAGEFNASLFDAPTIFIMINILAWLGLGMYFLIPRRIRFGADEITKSGLFGARSLPYEQIDHLRLTYGGIYVNGSNLFNFVWLSSIMHVNFDLVAGVLSQKVDEVDMEVKGSEELVEAFLQSEEGQAYLQKPARLFGSTSSKGITYFAGFSVVAIGIIALLLTYAAPMKQAMGKWVFLGVYFLLIAALMWIGGNILLKYSNREKAGKMHQDGEPK